MASEYPTASIYRAIGFPCLFHLKPISPLLRRRNPKHALRLAGQFSETLIFLLMVNGILQWIRRVFRLKPSQIKLAITRTVICFHFRWDGDDGWGWGVTVVTGSPMVSSDGLGKSNGGDTSSVSPVPYVFNGVFRGRKHGAIEKVVERRQRKMIKNRESTARSRARKQMADLLTALMYAVQVMNFLKTLITKNLREREDVVIESSRGPPQEPPLDENGDQGPRLSPHVQQNHDEHEEKDDEFAYSGFCTLRVEGAPMDSALRDATCNGYPLRVQFCNLLRLG
ncbi:putative transcription factor bZIP family [Helianthus annuus]|nr:putative transcription factor bZIP family [Helianthus annuus]